MKIFPNIGLLIFSQLERLLLSLSVSFCLTVQRYVLNLSYANSNATFCRLVLHSV
nr:MAG TPA: hypothetical protein [Caudoviricetes sp.]